MDNPLEHLFAQDGLLAAHISDYAPRPQQLEMAQAIERVLAESGVLIAEAGTGTGKTYAYLAPAMLSGQKVLISTGTKNLQDQLFYKDLPVLKKALGIPLRAALLKGRSNYLCHYRLGLAHGDPLLKGDAVILQSLSNWLGKTKTGDLSESHELEEQSPLWSRVTSTVDNCLGQDCPNISECFIAKARRKAQDADIVVVNHHLLMSDLALKTSGQGEVLPSVDAYILDEAHQLPEIASQFLGSRLSSHQILELCRDSIREMTQDAADMHEVKDWSDKVYACLQSFQLQIGEKEQRIPWTLMLAQTGVETALEALEAALESLSATLEQASERGPGLAQCHQRCQVMLDTLTVFRQPQSDDNQVLWIERRQNSLIMHATPQDVGPYFQQWMEEKPTAWVMTSATLTVAGKFNNFKNQLGILQADTAVWPSPFNYQQQSLLYMPTIPVEPNHEAYQQYIAEIALDMIQLSQGRTFLLFTSYRAMHSVAQWLEDKCDYPLLVQGTEAKTHLLESFRSHGHAVLLGTNSFWEGVDVRGQALSCVMIDKIPFASPGDPVLQARIDALRQRGGNPFTHIQIPSAVIQLKQGIGRLIRDPADYGVLVLCDPRFLTKPYGKLFLRSLPAMPITQNKEDVAAFFVAKSESGH